MPRYLSVVEGAYRATIEEQDDTGLWFTHAIRNAGAEVAVLLRGDAVSYAQRGQDAGGLRFGARAVGVPPEMHKDVEAMMAKGIAVHVVAEDLQQRGIPRGALLPGVTPLSRATVAGLVGDYDRVLHW